MLYLIQNCEKIEAQKTSLIITKLLRIYDDYGDKQFAAHKVINNHQLQILGVENSQLKSEKQILQEEISKMRETRN